MGKIIYNIKNMTEIGPPIERMPGFVIIFFLLNDQCFQVKE